MSNQAQECVEKVGHKQSCLNQHSGGGRQAVRLKLTWWRQETSVPAQIDMVGGR